MSTKPIKLGIVGVGKIVRDQHLPSIYKNSAFELIATASRNASVEGVAAYKSIEEMIKAVPQLDAVALCMPPQYRYAAANFALEKGLHVLLEKPPGATVSEVEQLEDLASQKSVSLYATWHSRHGAAVEKAKDILANATIKSVKVAWKEDVRKWHPNQEWIWQAGGLGVFDPGINGLSILTYILPDSIFVMKSVLSFPENRAAPIAAQMTFSSSRSLPVEVDFDWRQSGNEVWNIDVETSNGMVNITHGGGKLLVKGQAVDVGEHSEHGEYETIYARFADVISQGKSDVDLTPLKLAADTFLLGDRKIVEPFLD